MKKPTISIIIPVFNGKRTLEKTLRSVWAQSLPALEILVIDGGSTDGTQAIIQAHENRISYWISEPDKGVYSAINKGIRKATGEWIYILGSDDALASTDVLESASAHLTDSYDVVFGSVRNLNVKHSMVPEVHVSSMSTALYIRNTLHQQSAFYRRSLFGNEPFDSSLRVLADYDFHLSLFRRGIHYKSLDLIIAECEASGLSKQFNAALYREEFRLKKNNLGWLAALSLSPVIAAKYVFKQLR